MKTKTTKFTPLWIVLSSVIAGCANEPDFSASTQLYNKNCKVCHASGINGAPILGNVKMWEKRLPQGVEVLTTHANQGYGLMPAKGGSDLSDAQVKQVVAYMMYQVQ